MSRLDEKLPPALQARIERHAAPLLLARRRTEEPAVARLWALLFSGSVAAGLVAVTLLVPKGTISPSTPPAIATSLELLEQLELLQNMDNLQNADLLRRAQETSAWRKKKS